MPAARSLEAKVRTAEGEGTDLTYDRLEFWLIGERTDKDFGWGNQCWEGEDATLFIFWTRPIAVFDQGIQNSADSK